MSLSKEELKELMRSVIREENQSRKPEQPQQNAESFSDHVSSCPNCLNDVMEKLNKTSEYVCESCGFPLKDEAFMKQLKSCPNCGKTKAKKV
jgi:rubrerythrin